ncbi:tRNA-intron lyase [Candidatus Woesearchaeota archaeon]|nr:tRNA-intron lyase [Candidatus Woesearchaeota archaeon]
MEKKPKEAPVELDIQQKINAEYLDGKVLAEANEASREFYDKSRYGEPLQKKFQYSLVEALYLLERGKMTLLKGNKELSFDQLMKLAVKTEANLFVRYAAFKDMRNRGYIVKTALKFGADFRIYDRGVKPGDDHAKWIMYPVAETSMLTWFEFSAKNRVAHSTRKRLLIAVVDEESDCTFYEVNWKRP